MGLDGAGADKQGFPHLLIGGPPDHLPKHPFLGRSEGQNLWLGRGIRCHHRRSGFRSSVGLDQAHHLHLHPAGALNLGLNFGGQLPWLKRFGQIIIGPQLIALHPSIHFPPR